MILSVCAYSKSPFLMKKFQEAIGFGELENSALRIPDKLEKKATESLLKDGWKRSDPPWLFIPPLDKYICACTNTGYPSDLKTFNGWCKSKETKKYYCVCPLTRYLVLKLCNVEPPNSLFSEYGYHTPNGIVIITKKGWEEIKGDLSDV